MPCQSYDAYDAQRDIQEAKALRDKLARIACRAMSALEQSGNLTLIVDKEALSWWKQHKLDDAAAEARRIKEAMAARTAARTKRTALDKLTPAERKALGVK